MADHQSRSSHLSVVPVLADLDNVLEIAGRTRAHPAELPSHVAVAELTRSSDPLVVLTSLADKLLGMGYDCWIDVVLRQRPRWTVTRGSLDAQPALLQQLADRAQDEPLTLCDGRLVAVGFRGPEEESESMLLPPRPHAGSASVPASTDTATGTDPAAASTGSTGVTEQDAAEGGCSCGRPTPEFAGVVVVRRPDTALTASDAEVVHSVVDHALGVLAAERLREQLDRQRNRVQHLEQALSTNREIGVAIGILMAGRRCNAEEAFAVLRSVSQNSNRKIRDIAAQLAYTGELPVPPPRRAQETACGSVPMDPDPMTVSGSDRVPRRLQPQ